MSLTKIKPSNITSTGVIAGSYTAADITVNSSGQITGASSGLLAQGIQGIQGISGYIGQDGAQGIQGIQGVQGVQGIEGIGIQGTAGISIQGIQGIQGPSGTGGNGSNYGGVGYLTYNHVGDGTQTTFSTNSELLDLTVSNILVTENGIVQVPTTDYSVVNTQIIFTTAPASGTNIQIRVLGLRGLQGTQGIQGTQGVQGTQGLDGAYAAQGIQGVQGVQGLSSNLERHYNIPGSVTVSTGTSRWWIQSNALIIQLAAQVTTAPTGTGIILSIKKNNVEVAQLTISANNFTTEANTNISVIKGDYFTVDVLQKGSIIAGTDLVISFLYRRT